MTLFNSVLVQHWTDLFVPITSQLYTFLYEPETCKTIHILARELKGLEPLVLFNMQP